jgi:hypothetical protein
MDRPAGNTVAGWGRGETAVFGSQPQFPVPSAQCRSCRWMEAAVRRMDARISSPGVREGGTWVDQRRISTRRLRRRTGTMSTKTPRCVRDARPQGREPAGRPHRRRPNRARAAEETNPPGPGAVSNSCIVAYRARSPARSAAEGHAPIQALRGFRKSGPRFTSQPQEKPGPETSVSVDSNLRRHPPVQRTCQANRRCDRPTLEPTL